MSTHNIPIFNTIKIKITVNYPKSAAMGFSKGLKNEFETTVVNEPSMFEPLKFYNCSLLVNGCTTNCRFDAEKGNLKDL